MVVGIGVVRMGVVDIGSRGGYRYGCGCGGYRGSGYGGGGHGCIGSRGGGYWGGGYRV